MSDLLTGISPTKDLAGSKQLDDIKAFREAAKEKKAFQDFEQMFVHLMLKEMRKTINESSWSTKSHATKMYEELMDEALATQIAESGQMGIGRQLQASMQAERIRQEIQVNEKSMTRDALEPIKV